jgi:integrating conjugative element protein (TIGR03757 family)
MRPAAALLLMLSGLTSAQAADAVAVEVFTDSAAYRLANAQGAAVYDLSAPQHLLDGISQGLPKNPETAKSIATGRFNAGKPSLAAAFGGHALAMRYGIAKIPAIVFNHGEAVAYGLTDVAQAARLYRQWRQGER